MIIVYSRYVIMTNVRYQLQKQYKSLERQNNTRCFWLIDIKSVRSIKILFSSCSLVFS